MQFSGTQIKYWYSQAPHHGIATVSIDNAVVGSVDLYAANRSDGSAFWTSPVIAAGNHTLKIVVSGTKNAASTDSVVIIDRVDILTNSVTPSPSSNPTLTQTPSPTATPGAKSADMTGDGHVNIFDLSYLLSKWGTNDSKADLNSSGTVDIFDLSALLSQWTG
jgi:hypothetical protein